jgi:hypothetical protein
VGGAGLPESLNRVIVGYEGVCCTLSHFFWPHDSKGVQS